MKKIYLFLTMLLVFVAKAQTPIITMIADGDETGGTPKVVEIYANGTVDFSLYSLENQNNTSNTWGNNFSLAPLGTVTDAFVYVYSDGSNAGIFDQNFPSVQSSSKQDATSSGVLSINGDDRVRIIDSSSAVVDIYGVDGQDGTGEAWEYKDGYAKRNDATGPDATFDVNNWSFYKGDLNTHGAVQDGTDYESIVGIGTYVPQSAPAGPYFTEDFENGGTFPSGWTLTNGTDDWQIDDGTSHGPGSAQEGTYCAYFDDYWFGAGTTADMITPNIDLSNATAPELTFWYWDSNGTDTVEILVSTDGTTYNNVFTTPDQVSSWTKYTVDLTAYAGQSTVTIAFRGTSVYGFSNPHVDNIRVAEMPSCLDPTNLAVANVTTDSAELSWDDAGGDAGNYKLEYQEDGAGTWTVASSSATSPYSLTGLNPNTLYHWQLTKDCGASGSSLTVGGDDFHTECATITALPVSEDFESATAPDLPDCFSNETLASPAKWLTTNSGVHPSSASPHSGSVMLRFNSYSASSGREARFISPNFDLPNNAGSSLIVSYYMYHDSGYSSSNDRVQVQLFDGTNWVDVGNEVSRNNGNTGWEKVEVDVSAYAGQTVKFALKGISGYGNDIYVDDLKVEELSCLAPFMTVDSKDATSIDLSFTGGSAGADFALVWGQTGFTPDFSSPNAQLTAGTTNYQITGLDEVTSYDIYIQSDCGGGQLSDVTGPLTVQTTLVNDACSGALPLVTYAYGASTGHEVDGDTTLADDSGVQTNCDTYGTNLDLWYTILLPNNATGIRILTAGDKGANIESAIYDSCGGTAIACDGQSGEHIYYGLTGGQQYFIQVWHDDYGSIKGAFTIAVEVAPQISNDDCANATNLAVYPVNTSAGNETTGTTAYAQDGTVTPSCASGVVKDLFYKFTVPANVTDVRVLTSDSNAKKLNVSLYDACGGNEIACESGYYFHTFTGLTSGNTYYMQIWHDAGDEGMFDIAMEVAEQVVNDDCANATVVNSIPYIISQDASYATGGIITDCGSGMNDGVWYKFTGDGGDITLTLTPGQWDPEIAVYTGSCGSFTCEGYKDAHGTGGEETLTVTTTAGTEYYVNIGYWSNVYDKPEGNFTLRIDNEASLGVDINTVNGLMYYPNPVNNSLHITANTNIQNIMIFDVSGKVIRDLQPNQTTMQIDLSDIKKGVYFVKAIVNDNLQTFRIIKE